MTNVKMSDDNFICSIDVCYSTGKALLEGTFKPQPLPETLDFCPLTPEQSISRFLSEHYSIELQHSPYSAGFTAHVYRVVTNSTGNNIIPWATAIAANTSASTVTTNYKTVD